MSMANIDVKALAAGLVESGASWTAAENEFTGMTLDEFSNLLGYNPPPDSGELTLEAREVLAAAQGRVEAGYGAIGAPAAYDLRNVGGVNYDTRIRNQLSCGSCVAFGSIAAVEGTMRVSRRDSGLAIDLSENHLFNCIARSQGRRCAIGWWVDPAMRALRDQGVVDEACSPYSPADQPCVLCGDEAQRRVRILGFEELRSVSAMKEWIATKGPVAGCFSVYSDFSAYSSGVYRKTPNAVLRGGHCIAVIGYDDAASAWICKNSWGEGFGENGYFRIGYGECGIDASMWGVQTGASPTPSEKFVPLYRYWNPDNADHFYTTSWQELGEGRWGWGFEGVQCFVSPRAGGGLVPLYRYWNPDIGDHFYTTAWEELGEGRWGWGFEGIQCYVAPTQLAGTIPLYRYWNPGGGDHFYTTSWAELGEGAYGWGFEGVQCYVWPTAAGLSGGSGGPPATFRAGPESATPSAGPTAMGSGPSPSFAASMSGTGVPSSFGRSASRPRGSSFALAGRGGAPEIASSFRSAEASTTSKSSDCGCGPKKHG